MLYYLRAQDVFSCDCGWIVLHQKAEGTFVWLRFATFLLFQALYTNSLTSSLTLRIADNLQDVKVISAVCPGPDLDTGNVCRYIRVPPRQPKQNIHRTHTRGSFLGILFISCENIQCYTVVISLARHNLTLIINGSVGLFQSRN